MLIFQGASPLYMHLISHSFWGVGQRAIKRRKERERLEIKKNTKGKKGCKRENGAAERKWGMTQRRWVRKRRQFSDSSLIERRSSWMTSDSASGKVSENWLRHFAIQTKQRKWKMTTRPPRKKILRLAHLHNYWNLPRWEDKVVTWKCCHPSREELEDPSGSFIKAANHLLRRTRVKLRFWIWKAATVILIATDAWWSVMRSQPEHRKLLHIELLLAWLALEVNLHLINSVKVIWQETLTRDLWHND